MNKKRKRAQRRAKKRLLKRPHFIASHIRTERGRKVTFIQSSELKGLLNDLELSI